MKSLLNMLGIVYNTILYNEEDVFVRIYWIMNYFFEYYCFKKYIIFPNRIVRGQLFDRIIRIPRYAWFYCAY